MFQLQPLCFLYWPEGLRHRTGRSLNRDVRRKPIFPEITKHIPFRHSLLYDIFKSSKHNNLLNYVNFCYISGNRKNLAAEIFLRLVGLLGADHELLWQKRRSNFCVISTGICAMALIELKAREGIRQPVVAAGSAHTGCSGQMMLGSSCYPAMLFIPAGNYGKKCTHPA